MEGVPITISTWSWLAPIGNLLKRARRQDVALLELFAGAAAERRTDQGDGGGRAHAAPARGQAARRAHA